MDWYRVVKTINGRKYLYWQKTYRVGRSVKTLNKYIGPAGETYRLAGLVVSNKATNLRIIERDGKSVLGHLTGKKVYHLEGDVPSVHPAFIPPPAVMEFATLKEAPAVLNTAKTFAAGPVDIDAMRRRNALERRIIEAEAEDEYYYHHHATPEERKEMERAKPDHFPPDPKAFKPVILDTKERREDERIQYGNLAARVRKRKSKQAEAKRNTKHVKKKLNQFIAQVIKKT